MKKAVQDKVVEIRKDVEGSGTLSESLSASSYTWRLAREGYCFLYIFQCLKPAPDNVILAAAGCFDFSGKPS